VGVGFNPVIWYYQQSEQGVGSVTEATPCSLWGMPMWGIRMKEDC